MLRVALVRRSTDVRPEFSGLIVHPSVFLPHDGNATEITPGYATVGIRLISNLIA